MNQLQQDFIKYLSQPSKKRILIEPKKYKSIEKNQFARNIYLYNINELNETLWKTIVIRKIKSLEKVKE